MMVCIGNFLFHYRNGIFPLMYVLLFIPAPPLLASWELALGLGAAIAVAGQLLRAVTIGLEYIIRGGRNRQVYAEKLVQGGIFAHCRNPLYLGNFIIILGVGIASNSVLFVSVTVPFFVFCYWAIIAAEENYLRNKFGSEFDDYCARVNRIMPNFAGIGQTLSGMTFNWRRLVSVEYGSTYIWVGGIILVTLKNLWLSGEYLTNHALVWSLWTLLAAATCGYGLARFLKKSRLLEAAKRPAA